VKKDAFKATQRKTGTLNFKLWTGKANVFYRKLLRKIHSSTDLGEYVKRVFQKSEGRNITKER